MILLRFDLDFNMTASKIKSTDSSFETLFYTTSNDDESSVKDVSIEILKLPKRIFTRLLQKNIKRKLTKVKKYIKK